MSWNRKEVGGLLMVGAGIIATFETAIFSKWVDAKIVEKVDIASSIAWVGFLSTVLFGVTWFVARNEMNKPLAESEKLSWEISCYFIFIYLVLALSWFIAI